MSTPFFGRLSIHLDRTGFKPPHLFSKTHAHGRLWQKIAALVPLLAVSCIAHGWPAGRALGGAICGAMIAEALGAWIFRRLPAYQDGESILMGLFCAMVLPLTLPIWFFFAAAFIAVFLGREVFGGFGQAIIFPPALGLLILFLSLPQMIQAFDFKAAQALVMTLPMSEDRNLNPVHLMFYPAGATLEDVSFLALVLGAVVLLTCGLVRWELPLLCVAGMSVVRLCFEKNNPVFFLSGGLWLTVFWGLAQTSAMPLTPVGRRIYALLAGLLAAACPLGDETLRLLTGLAAASLISPWIDTILTLHKSQSAGVG